MRENPGNSFLYGLKVSTPLLLGVASFAVAYGLLAVKAGLSLLSLSLMSLLVFAGASQFLTIAMLLSGTPAALILFTTFIVNSRHFLMGASLGPYVRKWSLKWRLALSFLLTDESYALTIKRFMEKDADRYYQLGASLGFYAIWVVFSVMGGLLGPAIGDPQTFGLDFALPATFIAILVPMIATWRHVAVCSATAVFAVIGVLFLPVKWYVPFAAVSGTIFGGLLEAWKRK